MKAQDLMIGDWVIIDHPTIGKQAERVIHVEEDCIMTNETFTTLFEVDPVPLTAEILEKNFAKRLFFDGEFEGYSYVTDGMQIDQLADSVFVWICPGTINGILSLRYVHELQHALRLCGIEKEIQL